MSERSDTAGPRIDGIVAHVTRGTVWPDGWASPVVEISCIAMTDLGGLELRGWNPDWSAAYAHNVVHLQIEDSSAQSVELAMGEVFVLRLARPIAANGAFRVLIRSDIWRPADELDERERGVILESIKPIEAVAAIGFCKN